MLMTIVMKQYFSDSIYHVSARTTNSFKVLLSLSPVRSADKSSCLEEGDV